MSTNMLAQSQRYVSICFHSLVKPKRSSLVATVSNPTLASFPADPKQENKQTEEQTGSSR